MKKILSLSFLLVFVVLAFFLLKNRSTQPSSIENTKKTHHLIVSVLPQKQIVEKIAGDSFTTTALIPPGFSPATYDPTLEEMKIISQAEMYFRIGHIPFEKTHLEKLQEINPSMKVIDTSVNNTLREIEDHSHGDADDHHKEEDDHHEENIDPHVWISPNMVQQQAQIIYDSLVDNYPEYSEKFTKNHEQLVRDLKSLDEELENAFTPIKGKSMFVYHPAFGYLARDYGFIQEHIEIEGKEPSIEDIQEIITQAKQENVKVIFVQKQFSKDSALAIADNIDGVVVEIDPLDPDYFANMKDMAKTISNSLIE